MMDKIKFFGFLIGLLMLIASCAKEEAKDLVVPGQFFDLKTFFNQESERLKNIDEVKKKAIVDGKEEIKIVEGFKFMEELALFIDSDINRIAWLDRYEVDSIFSADVLSEIVYKAKDDKLKTNVLSIQFKNKAVNQIKIIRKTSSIAAKLEQELIYQPNQGYSIKSSQKTSLSDPHILALDVQFIR